MYEWNISTAKSHTIHTNSVPYCSSTVIRYVCFYTVLLYFTPLHLHLDVFISYPFISLSLACSQLRQRKQIHSTSKVKSHCSESLFIHDTSNTVNQLYFVGIFHHVWIQVECWRSTNFKSGEWRRLSSFDGIFYFVELLWMIFHPLNILGFYRWVKLLDA